MIGYEYTRFGLPVVVVQTHAKTFGSPLDHFVREQFAQARSDPELKLTGHSFYLLRGSHCPIPKRGGSQISDLVLHHDSVDLPSIKRPIAKQRAPAEQEWPDHGVIEASSPGWVAQVPIDIVVTEIEPETHMFLDAGQRLDRNENTFRHSAAAQ